MTIRKNFLVALEKIILLLSKSKFSPAIDQIFLLGSFFSPKPHPNDLDLMIIGTLQIEDLSVLRTQYQIKEFLFSNFTIRLSINFGSSITSIVFADGIPIEKYLLLYSRFYTVRWTQWFSKNGVLRYSILSCFSAIDTPVLRYFDHPDNNVVNVY